MMDAIGPELWWGLPRVRARADAQSLLDDLAVLWLRSIGSPLSDLSSDLKSLRSWFDPLATGRKLRTMLAALPPANPAVPVGIGDPYVYRLPMGNVLITPEGRLLIEALQVALATSSAMVSITAEQFFAAEESAREFYRSLALQRIDSVVVYLDPEHAPLLHPSGIGALLFMLVNRSTSRDRAIRRPEDSRRFDQVDGVIQDAIAAFADAIEPPKGTRRSDQYSLYSGYAMTEASRRLPHVLVADGDHIYIEPSGLQLVEDRIGSELRRRKKSPAEVGTAFDALVGAQRRGRPVLAREQLAFDRPSDTDALRHRIVQGLNDESVPTVV